MLPLLLVKENSIYFSVISGSFRSKSNAKKQLNELISQGYQASFTSLNPKGLFRVAYARLNTRKEAASLIFYNQREWERCLVIDRRLTIYQAKYLGFQASFH